MARPRVENPVNGGADTARRRGMVGILIHVTPEQRRRIRKAAALAEQPMSELGRDSLIATADKILAKAGVKT